MKTLTVKNKNARFTPRNQGGFTIIETLVAITILMISIAGPLVVASKGLFGANIAKNQMVASYLAQESMEVVKNIRDNNLDAGNYWLTGVSGCTQANKCDASAIDGVGTNPSIAICPAGSLCAIYAGAIGYGHNASGASTIFKRGFYIHAANGPSACVSDEECSVTVEVDWIEGQTPYEIRLTSEITSTIR